MSFQAIFLFLLNFSELFSTEKVSLWKFNNLFIVIRFRSSEPSRIFACQILANSGFIAFLILVFIIVSKGKLMKLRNRWIYDLISLWVNNPFPCFVRLQILRVFLLWSESKLLAEWSFQGRIDNFFRIFLFLFLTFFYKILYFFGWRSLWSLTIK